MFYYFLLLGVHYLNLSCAPPGLLVEFLTLTGVGWGGI